MAEYYEKQLKCKPIAVCEDEAKLLLRNCGFAYLEQIIKNFDNGGKKNGTSIC